MIGWALARWRRLSLSTRMAVVLVLWAGVIWIGFPFALDCLGQLLAPISLISGSARLLGLIPLVPAAALASFCAYTFATQGQGTPLPYDPPQQLVTSGPYAYSRNPMMAGHLLLMTGQAILLDAWLLLVFVLIAVIGGHFFVLWVEEPSLRARFGSDYQEYCRHVPRWGPRLTPYRSQP